MHECDFLFRCVKPVSWLPKQIVRTIVEQRPEESSTRYDFFGLQAWRGLIHLHFVPEMLDVIQTHCILVQNATNGNKKEIEAASVCRERERERESRGRGSWPPPSLLMMIRGRSPLNRRFLELGKSVVKFYLYLILHSFQQQNLLQSDMIKKAVHWLI